MLKEGGSAWNPTVLHPHQQTHTDRHMDTQTHTDTQSFGFSISAQFPEIIRFLNVGSFRNNILGIPLAVQWLRP